MNAIMADPNLNSPQFFALRVALQTMKERCLALQRRLTTVEEENQQLRDDTSANGQGNSSNGGAAENFQLRLQMADLQRQKTQLNEHITMVSNENRKLWSRLSQIAKEQGKPISASDSDCTLANEGAEPDETLSSPRSSAAGGSSGGANQNLIRSKTFTQHSPNPNLRHKILSGDPSAAGALEIRDISLEEVALDAYENKDMGGGEDYAEAELGFAYLNVDETAAATGASSNEADFNLEAKKCIEGLQNLRREALKQQRDLNSTLTMLESRNALQPCPDCAQQKSQKPEMADKSLETDESLNEVKFYNNRPTSNDTATSHTMVNGQRSGLTEPESSPAHLDIIQEKIQADKRDKICPMCGKSYTSAVSFNAFREHVEMHFIDEASEVEASIERNFEFISHAVGDF